MPKRKVSSELAGIDLDAPIPLKKQRSTRTRKGGTQVGSCEEDRLILDHQRRAIDDAPVIPPHTKFLLTTDPTRISGELTTSTTEEDRYFDRPEVKESVNAQLAIQTPEFRDYKHIALNARSRGRKGEEQEAYETSDEMYLQRHSKYEKRERRQRTREREALQRDHYRLKLRVEALKGLDPSAFVHLLPNTSSQSEDDYDHEVAACFKQGMIDTAADLDRRYRILLPPGQRYPPKAHSKEKDIIEQSPVESTNVVEAMSAPASPSKGKPKSKLNGIFAEPPLATTTLAKAASASPAQRSPARSPVNRRATISVLPTVDDAVSPNSAKAIKTLTATTSLTLPATQSKKPASPKSMKAARAPPRMNAFEQEIDELHDSSPAGSPPPPPPSLQRRKRQRTSEPSSVPQEGSWDWDKPLTRPKGKLSELENFAAKTSTSVRKTGRNIKAFGFDIPTNVTAPQDFQLPHWTVPESDPRVADGAEGIQWDRSPEPEEREPSDSCEESHSEMDVDVPEPSKGDGDRLIEAVEEPKPYGDSPPIATLNGEADASPQKQTPVKKTYSKIKGRGRPGRSPVQDERDELASSP